MNTLRTLNYTESHFRKLSSEIWEETRRISGREKRGEINHDRARELALSARECYVLANERARTLTPFTKEQKELTIAGVSFWKMLDDAKERIHKQVDEARSESDRKAETSRCLHTLIYALRETQRSFLKFSEATTKATTATSKASRAAQLSAMAVRIPDLIEQGYLKQAMIGEGGPEIIRRPGMPTYLDKGNPVFDFNQTRAVLRDTGAFLKDHMVNTPLDRFWQDVKENEDFKKQMGDKKFRETIARRIRESYSNPIKVPRDPRQKVYYIGGAIAITEAESRKYAIHLQAIDEPQLIFCCTRTEWLKNVSKDIPFQGDATIIQSVKWKRIK
jgi:hypothetical protein